MSNRITLILSLCLLSLSLTGKNQVVDQVIWVVGDEPILLSDVETEILRKKYGKEKVGDDAYCLIPEQIALKKLFIAQAKMDSIVVPESSVTQQVNGRIKYFIQQIGSIEKLEEYFNKTMANIRSSMEESVRDQLMMQEMQRNIISGNKISPSDVKRFYKDLPKDSIPTIQEEVEVQIITLQPTVTLAEEERIKSELRGFREKIESGEYEFSTLAILYSEDRGSALQGGELGYMTKGKLVPEFANAAFSLYNKEKISRIVKTEFGYHIIQLIDKKGDQTNCRHILMIPKISPERKQKALLRLDSVATLIRSNELSFKEAIKISEDKNTQQNLGVMIDPTGGDSKFLMKDLPPEVAKEVEKLKVGEISSSFVYINQKGKEIAAIIKLKSRTKSHLATPSEDFQTLKEIVSSERNEELIQKWIDEKQKETYIYIDPDYRDCEFTHPGWIKDAK